MAFMIDQRTVITSESKIFRQECRASLPRLMSLKGEENYSHGYVIESYHHDEGEVNVFSVMEPVASTYI